MTQHLGRGNEEGELLGCWAGHGGLHETGELDAWEKGRGGSSVGAGRQ